MTARIDDGQGRDQRTTSRYTSRRNMPSAQPVRGRPRKTDGYTDHATGTDAARYTSADAEGRRRTVFTGAKFPAAARPDSRPYRRLRVVKPRTASSAESNRSGVPPQRRIEYAHKTEVPMAVHARTGGPIRHVGCRVEGHPKVQGEPVTRRENLSFGSMPRFRQPRAQASIFCFKMIELTSDIRAGIVTVLKPSQRQ